MRANTPLEAASLLQSFPEVSVHSHKSCQKKRGGFPPASSLKPLMKKPGCGHYQTNLPACPLTVSSARPQPNRIGAFLVGALEVSESPNGLKKESPGTSQSSHDPQIPRGFILATQLFAPSQLVVYQLGVREARLRASIERTASRGLLLLCKNFLSCLQHLKL